MACMFEVLSLGVETCIKMNSPSIIDDLVDAQPSLNLKLVPCF